MKFYVLVFMVINVLSLMLNDPFAQEGAEKSEKKERVCHSNLKYKQFDFWLGQFDVYGDLNKNSPLFGTNRISKKQKGCLIIENWVGSKGTTGTSMNYYDGTTDQWVQHWMSADGTTINIKGNIVDGSMVLVGKIYYASVKKNSIRDFKGTWTPLESGVIRQFFEESIDSGKTWYPWFEGFYFPQ